MAGKGDPQELGRGLPSTDPEAGKTASFLCLSPLAGGVLSTAYKDCQAPERGRSRWREGFNQLGVVQEALHRTYSLAPPATRVREVRQQRASSLPPARKISIRDFIESTGSSVSAIWEDLPGDALRHVCLFLPAMGDIVSVFGTCRTWRVHLLSLHHCVPLFDAPPLLLAENQPPPNKWQWKLWDPSNVNSRLSVSYMTPPCLNRVIGYSHGYLLSEEGGACYLTNMLNGRCVMTVRMPVTSPQRGILSGSIRDDNCCIVIITRGHVIVRRVNTYSAWSGYPLHVEGGVIDLYFVGRSSCYLLAGDLKLYELKLAPYLECNEVNMLRPEAWRRKRKCNLWLADVESQLMCIHMAEESSMVIVRIYCLTRDLLVPSWIMWQPITVLDNCSIFLSKFGGFQQAFACVNASRWNLAENHFYFPAESQSTPPWVLLRLGNRVRIPSSWLQSVRSCWTHPDLPGCDEEVKLEMDKLLMKEEQPKS